MRREAHLECIEGGNLRDSAEDGKNPPTRSDPSAGSRPQHRRPRLGVAVILSSGGSRLEAFVLRQDIVSTVESAIPEEVFESAPFDRIAVYLRCQHSRRTGFLERPPLCLLDDRWLEVNLTVSIDQLYAADGPERVAALEAVILGAVLIGVERFAHRSEQ